MDTFRLRNGDRVLFYGDSITGQGFYANYLEAFAQTRFPDRDIRFFNAAWSGDATWGGAGGSSEERVRRDVRPFRPTVIVIMLGMNDAGYVPFDPRIYGIFREWYGKLLGWMRQAAPRARITLIQTTPYDDYTRKPPAFAGYNTTLLRFGTVVRELAEKRGHTFVDGNMPLVTVLRKASTREAALAAKIIPDFIHPAPAGHLVLAGCLLDSWNAPTVVTDVRLHAAQNRVLLAANARVSGFDGRRWTQKDRALPFAPEPSDPATSLVLLCTDIIERHNQQRLIVAGLPTNTYRLTIDNHAVGSFTAEQLARGIDLAFRDTPMHRQAQRVLENVKQKNRIAFLLWREVQIPGLASPGKTAAVRGLERLESELREKARTESQPRIRRYALAPISG